MWAQTGFSFARASVQQEVAFVGFAIFTIGFLSGSLCWRAGNSAPSPAFLGGGRFVGEDRP